MEQSILSSLDGGFFQSAVFLSERLFYQDQTKDRSRALYGLCLLEASRSKEAVVLLRDAPKHLSCAWIYARAALKEGLFTDGAAALTSVWRLWNRPSALPATRLSPSQAHAYCMLGHLYKANGEVQQSVDAYTRAVEEDAYMWEALEGLLSLGVDIQIGGIFNSSSKTSQRSQQIRPQRQETRDAMTEATPNIFDTRPTGAKPVLLDNSSMSPDTPSEMNKASHALPVARPRSRLGDFAPPKFGLSRVEPPSLKEGGSLTRRSSRLLPGLTKRSNGDRREAKRNKIPADDEADTNPVPDVSPLDVPMSTLRALADAYYALKQYQCVRSISLFDSVAEAQRMSPFVLACKARAAYESADYQLAEKVFRQLRRVSPARVLDLELYSTCLWHLDRPVELSYLAHEAMNLDRTSPQAWCVLANCFSLQREHEQALRCVRRAIELDDAFAYAHTLEGHEYAAMEDFDRAHASFRRALRCDGLHYNAWYGLGMTYMKTGLNEQAHLHFDKAAQINPTNAVLVCCRGIVLERQQRHNEALDMYILACELAPTNALARFKKAKALMLARDYTQAMNDLHILRELAPEEANVHYLLGKLYKQLGDKHSAMKHFTIAVNLDNKASQLVKETVENMDELDEQLS
ncbi:anaphase-promoting complex subunit cdc27 [Savitreella phatthalungensis]